jgi:hypothetical protein
MVRSRATANRSEPTYWGKIRAYNTRQSGLPKVTSASRCGWSLVARANSCIVFGSSFLSTWRHLGDIRDGPLIPSHRPATATSARGTCQVWFAIAEIIKRRARAARLDPDRYSGHSLRAGFATSAAAAGASELAIARQTRHGSMAVLRGYIREGDLFRINAASTLGL